MSAANNRTEELRRNRRARSLSDGNRPLFMRWPQGDEYAHVEGKILELWDSKHGRMARLAVHQASEGAPAVMGSGDGQEEFDVRRGMNVNLGLHYAGLRGIGEQQVGEIVHFAFSGWGVNKDGNRYRRFEAFVLDGPAEIDEPDGDEAAGGLSSPDDDLPF